MEAQLASPLFPAVALEESRPRTAESWRHVPATAADAWHDLPSFQDKVFCLCLGFMGNAADARDLTQDTFAKALAHADQAPPEHMQAWLLRIARNSCLDQMRRFKVRGPLQPLSEFSAVCRQTPEDLPARPRRSASSAGPSPACRDGCATCWSCANTGSSPARRSAAPWASATAPCPSA